MKFFDYIRFGLKNIARSKARTILTVFAVVIGAISVLLMLTIIFGAKNAAIGQIESIGALTQVTVSGSTDLTSDDVFNGSGRGGSDNVKLTDALLDKVKALPHVDTAYAQVGVYNLQTATLDGGDGKKLNMGQVVAYVPGANTDRTLAAGRNFTTDDVEKVIIGNNILGKLGFKGHPEQAIGQVLDFEAQGYTAVDKDSMPKPPQTNNPQDGDQYWQSLQKHISTIKATIIGVMPASPFDDSTFVPMAFANEAMTQYQWQPVQQQQQQFDSHGNPQPMGPPQFELKSFNQLDQQGYSTFVVKVDKAENVASVAAQIKTDLKLGAATAQDVIDQILKIFRVISIVFGAIGAISLLVAAIGVINTMIMATLERTREIGVMRACGATKATVRRLFTFEAGLLGFWGGIVGYAIGQGLLMLASHFGGSELSKQGIPLSILNIPLWLAAATVAATTIIGLLAGYGPAIRAAGLDPVEALRYE